MANADTRPVPALIMYGAKIQATWPGKVAVLPEWMCGNGYLPETEFRDERYAGRCLKTAFHWQCHKKLESVPRYKNGAHFHLWGFSAFYGHKGKAKFLYLQIFRLFYYSFSADL